jgi:pimeloyl-ACP methyl ester carboxylesterase
MSSRLQTVRSSDGTTIAYEQFGAGPPLVLVHGSISDRSYWTPVVPVLAEHFTVVTVDRRGRGDSGDTDTYALEREFEDLAAVVAAIAEPVHLVGHSYGGLCALGAARVSDDLASLTLYEPALVDDAAIPEEFVAALEAMVAAGERDAAVELMMGELVGLPVEALADLRADSGAWQPMVDCVHTLPRELRGVGTFAFDANSFRDLDVPTLLLRGADSPPELHVGIDMVLAAIGGARAVTMPGVGHEAVTTGPDVLVTALTGVPA